jgi:hypothetical protein
MEWIPSASFNSSGCILKKGNTPSDAGGDSDDSCGGHDLPGVRSIPDTPNIYFERTWKERSQRVHPALVFCRKVGLCRLAIQKTI